MLFSWVSRLVAMAYIYTTLVTKECLYWHLFQSCRNKSSCCGEACCPALMNLSSPRSLLKGNTKYIYLAGSGGSPVHYHTAPLASSSNLESSRIVCTLEQLHRSSNNPFLIICIGRCFNSSFKIIGGVAFAVS